MYVLGGYQIAIAMTSYNFLSRAPATLHSSSTVLVIDVKVGLLTCMISQ
jgi:hypothetical protein